jgi:hypothetical protein
MSTASRQLQKFGNFPISGELIHAARGISGVARRAGGKTVRQADGMDRARADSSGCPTRQDQRQPRIAGRLYQSARIDKI